jgi:isocitrate dehydrogenase kinase/phosphatase
MTDCNFRKIPLPRITKPKCPARSGIPVAKNDVFPGGIQHFFAMLANVLRKSLPQASRRPCCRKILAGSQQKIRDGHVEDFFPYPQEIRFSHIRN